MLEPAQSLRAQSMDKPKLDLHAMQVRPIARRGCKWLYQELQWLHVAG
jgi:hypothetical protein